MRENMPGFSRRDIQLSGWTEHHGVAHGQDARSSGRHYRDAGNAERVKAHARVRAVSQLARNLAIISCGLAAAVEKRVRP